MIKYWQSMQDYKYFLTESKAHFDFSERNRLHTVLDGILNGAATAQSPQIKIFI